MYYVNLKILFYVIIFSIQSLHFLCYMLDFGCCGWRCKCSSVDSEIFVDQNSIKFSPAKLLNYKKHVWIEVFDCQTSTSQYANLNRRKKTAVKYIENFQSYWQKFMSFFNYMLILFFELPWPNFSTYCALFLWFFIIVLISTKNNLA